MTTNRLKSNLYIGSCALIILFSGIAYVVHKYSLELRLYDPADVLLIRSYVVNVLLAIGIITILFWLSTKYSNYMGFIFMGASFLKFLVFFIFFYPVFSADGELKTAEFISFFIPYAIGLTIETVSVSKLLNKSV